MNPALSILIVSDAGANSVAPVPVTHNWWVIVRTSILLTIIIGFTLWVLIQAFRRSEAPMLLLLKWVLSVALGLVFWFVIGPIVEGGGYAAMGGVVMGMICGWGMAFIWWRDLPALFARPFSNLYDGGRQEIEARPFYSTANSKRKRGYYDEAVALIREQLEKFPTDFEGQMMLAEIQAENLNDLPAAAIGIQRICNQPGHAPRNIAYAQNSLADWYLKYFQDRDSAREALQKIIELMPDSEMATLAAQRIASLASTEHLVEKHDRKKFAVVEGVQNLGLLDPKFHPKPADANAAREAAGIVEHLHSHPLDAEARERLAVIYAIHYGRLDLATDQLEQMIASPNQPQKRVVHWLNLLADLQVRHATDYETVRATVQRIIDLFPKAAVADLAANRIAHLKLELKANAVSQSVKLGTYEQDIGLKM